MNGKLHMLSISIFMCIKHISKGDRGTRDCAGNPGNQGHEAQDAAFLAAHKVDWYKSDSCFAPQDQATAFQQYALMRDELNKTGWPIWFALCGWYPWYAPQGHSLANSWRIGPDTICGWSCIMSNVMNILPVAKYGYRSANGGKERG